MRNIRRDANDAFKKLTKQDVSEDEVKDLGDKVQKLTDKYIKNIDAAVEKKIQRNPDRIIGTDHKESHKTGSLSL